MFPRKNTHYGRFLVFCAIVGLIMQFAFPLTIGAAPPSVPDTAPASTTKTGATTTGSGQGKWERGAATSPSTTAKTSSSSNNTNHTGTPTKLGAKPGSSSGATNSLGPAASNLQYYPLSQPIRFYDSRPGLPAFSNNGTPDIGGTSYGNVVAGITYLGITIPGSALAVTGNVTVVADQGSGAGFVTLYPNGTSLPTTSNANYVDGQVVPNAFTVALGTGGSFRDYVSTTIDIVLDITGYYAAISGSGLYFHPLSAPIRYLDTRVGFSAYNTPGSPDTGGVTYSGTVAGITYGGITIPANATAISGNATVVADQGAGPGFLTLFPSGGSLPTVSNNNYVNGQVVPNAFFVGLGGGKLTTYNLTTTDIVIDINGYFSTSVSDVNGTGVLYNTLPYPIRMMDSRPGMVANGTACFGGFTSPQGFVGGNSYIILGGGTFNGTLFNCQGVTIPTSAVAVSGNATVVANLNAGPGFVTLFPTTSSRPNASNLNYVNDQVVPNFFIVRLGPATATNSGNVYSNAFLTYASTTVNEIFDLNGYFA